MGLVGPHWAGAVAVQGCAALLCCPEPPLGMGLFVVLLMAMVLMRLF